MRFGGIVPENLDPDPRKWDWGEHAKVWVWSRALVFRCLGGRPYSPEEHSRRDDMTNEALVRAWFRCGSWKPESLDHWINYLCLLTKFQRFRAFNQERRRSSVVIPLIDEIDAAPEGGTREQEAMVECTAFGPTGTTFVNPGDDPRKKQ